MTSIADNPAVTNPRQALTRPQQEALGAISFFRHQRALGRQWQIGNKSFSTTTIDALRQQQLVRSDGRMLHLTTAGSLALDKLKGQGNG